MTINKIQGDFVAPIIKSESTTSTDCIQEWVNGDSCSVLCITVDGKATFSHTSNAYDTIIDGNNICLNGGASQGNYICGSSSSYIRLPVGNGTCYFNFRHGAGSEMVRFNSVNNSYRTIKIIDNGIGTGGGPMSRLITWNGGFNTNPSICTGLHIGIDYNYTNWQDAGTFIHAAGGRDTAGVGEGQDINLLPGKKNPNASGTGEDGDVVIGDSNRSPKLIINRTGTTALIYVGSGNSLTFEDSITGTKTLAELAAGGGGGGTCIASTSTNSFAEFGNSGSDEFLTIKTCDTAVGDVITKWTNGDNAEKLRIDGDGNIWTNNNTLKGLFNSATNSNWFVAGAGGNTSKVEFLTASANVGVGEGALLSLDSGDNNTAIGFNSLDAITTGGNNSAIGRDSGKSVCTGGFNTFAGYNNGGTLTTGSFNVLLGASSDVADATDCGAISIGYLTYSDCEGVSIGYQAGNSGGGGRSVKIGYQAGRNTSSTNNVFAGSSAGFYLNGTGNVAAGFAAGFGTNGAIGTYNVLMGHQAATAINDGNYNLALGYRSGYNVLCDGCNNIFLGAYSGYYETGSCKLFISSLNDTDQSNEATARDKALIYGEMSATTSNQLLMINGILKLTQAKSGSTQSNAGAVANEIWVASGHTTLPDGVLLIGS